MEALSDEIRTILLVHRFRSLRRPASIRKPIIPRALAPSVACPAAFLTGRPFKETCIAATGAQSQAAESASFAPRLPSERA
jgi:hypothetical protein